MNKNALNFKKFIKYIRKNICDTCMTSNIKQLISATKLQYFYVAATTKAKYFKCMPILCSGHLHNFASIVYAVFQLHHSKTCLTLNTYVSSTDPISNKKRAVGATFLNKYTHIHISVHKNMEYINKKYASHCILTFGKNLLHTIVVYWALVTIFK